MILKERYINIMKEILQSTEKVDTAYLKTKFKVSERTIRNDLKEIDQYIQSKKLPGLTRSKKTGIRLDVTDIIKEQLLEDLRGTDQNIYALNSEERMHYILLYLIMSDEPVSVNEIADKLGFSKNTVVEDVKKLEIFLESKSCTLTKKRKIGMEIKSTEFQKRQMYIDLFIKHFNIGKWAIISGNLKELGMKFHIVIQQEMEKLLYSWNIKTIVSLLEEIQIKLKLKYTDTSINTLILALILSKYRFEKNQTIKLQRFQLETIKLSQEYKVLGNYLDEHKELFSENEHERAFIAMYMLTNKILEQEEGIIFDDSLKDLREITEGMIAVFEQDMGIKLTELQKDKLLKGLMLHMEPAVYRMRYNIGIANPMLEDIKTKYKIYYDSASKACMYLSQQLHIIVPEEEIGYIGIYFGGIMENKQKQRVKVILVCNAGMATVRILETRLLEEFQDIEIVDYLSYSEFSKNGAQNAEIVISTVKIDYSSKPTIVVNPLIDDDDVNKLKKYFAQRALQKTYHKKYSADQIIEIVEKYSTIHAKNPLKRELESLFGNHGKTDKKLSQLLFAEHVKLNQNANDWIDAVKLGTKQLIKSKHIEQSYEDAVIENIKRLKAYVVLKPYVALPHAKPEDGVNKLGISFVTLKKGVSFGHEKHDPVRLIIVLASENPTSHLRALNTVIKLIKNSETIDRLINSKTYSEIIAEIKTIEEDD